MEIIPTILVNSFDEVKERIKAVEKYVSWVQLDVMDGVFVNNTTWRNPKDLKKIKTKTKLEAHLMVEKPEEVIDEWLKTVDRVIIHFESTISDLSGLIKKIHNSGKQIGVAINPETRFSVVEPFLPRHGKKRGEKDLDLVLFMTVQPGWGGQKFREEVLVKIKSLREIWPNGNIEVDGGVNNENIGKIVKAGANLICVGTFIFKSKNIEEAIKNLQKL